MRNFAAVVWCVAAVSIVPAEEADPPRVEIAAIDSGAGTFASVGLSHEARARRSEGRARPGPTRAQLLEVARGFPDMPRETPDLREVNGGAEPTFASGTPFNDLEYTLFDTDYVEGETHGFDTFFPVDPSDSAPGSDTVKLVRGVNNLDLEAAYDGARGDRIVLGTGQARRPFFLRGPNQLDDDYAVIQNFDYSHGHIQLSGGADDYRLLYATRDEGVATEGHYLFFVGDGVIDLVAFIFPCDDIGLPVSGRPPADDQVLCDEDRRLSLADSVDFRFARTADRPPVVTVEGAVQIGTPGNEIVGGIAVDQQGRSYVFGASDGSLGGALTGSGHTVFVVQRTATGAEGWVFELATPNGTLLFDAVADADHLYVVGRTLGALPGYVNRGNWDAIMLKLRLDDGALVASHQFGNRGLDGYGNVTLDDAGQLYVSGAGSPSGASGTDDSYLVAKHRADTLEVIWRVIEPPESSGPIFVAEAWGGLSYAPGAAPGQGRLVAAGWYMTVDGADAFLSVYEELAASQPLRVATTSVASPGVQADWVLDTAVDRTGAIFAVGFTTGVLGERQQGQGDAFIVRFDPMLKNPVWLQLGTPRSDMFRRVVIGADGLLTAVGYTSGDWAPAVGHNADPEGVTADILLQSFDAELRLAGALQIGTPGEDRADVVRWGGQIS